MSEHETVEMFEEEATHLWQNSRGKALNGLINPLSDGVFTDYFTGLVFLSKY